MKKIWDKAVKNVTIVKAKAQETVFGDKKEDDPDFKTRSEQLKSIEQHAHSTIQAIATFNISLQKLSVDSFKVVSQFSSSFNDDDVPYKERADSLKAGVDEMQILINNLVQNRIPQQVIEPLQNVLHEIELIRSIEKKRMKNKILLDEAEKDLKYAEEKNKNVAEVEEIVAHRRAKYTKYNNDFLNRVAVLHDKKDETFGSSLTAFQFYIIETNRQIAEQIRSKMASLPYQELQGQIPSMTVFPVEESKA